MIIDADNQVRKAVSELEVERAETIEKLRIRVSNLEQEVKQLRQG